MNSVILKTFATALLFSATSSLLSKEKGIEERQKSPRRWHVTKDSIDSSLKKGESVFAFKFIDSYKGKEINETIKMAYNGKKLDSKKDEQGLFALKVKPGKYVFQFYYNKDYYEIKTDSIPVSSGFRKEITVSFESSLFPVECDKPVIYVYPKEKTEVNIELSLKGQLGFTYPQYKNNWNFVAEPNGNITCYNKNYQYLFWEGTTGLEKCDVFNGEGFIVNKRNLISFFEEKLTAMRLNAREQEDFITYWGPRMSANENNYVHFLFNEEFERYAPLTITPEPDKVFRVFMTWCKSDNDSTISLSEQKILTFDRTGFTVLEWGGAEIKPVLYH